MTAMDGCQLPDEILAKIFAYCRVGTLYNVMLACRRFRDCVNINSVWKSKLQQLLGLSSLREHLEVTDLSINFCADFENCKEICRRFCLVFNQKFKFDNELLKCAKCSSVFCAVGCIHDRDEMITFDFGSKTTWFKYAGEMTGQLSMHPTIGPMKTHAEDFWAAFSTSFTDSTALAYECCPVCARIILRRSANNVMLDAGLDRKTGQGNVHPNRFTKALSKLSSFKGLQCFSVPEGVDDDLVLLPGPSNQGASVAEAVQEASSTVTVDIEMKAFEMYKFLLQHLLSRNAFYHLHNIPFVICEPVGCDNRLKVELANVILCHFKAPGVCFIPKAVGIALYSGLETCLVVDSGANNTVVTPVADSLALSDCVQHLEIGGSHLTRQLLTCLSTKGIEVEQVNEVNIDSSQVKRECYLAYDAQLESRKRIVPRDIHIKGTKDDKPKYFDVKLSHELYQLAEDMYLHLQLPQLILQSLESLDSSLKRQLISNIILTGGNCRLSGLAHRLSHDLQRLLPGDLSGSVRVVDPRLMTGRSDAVIGASYIKKWHHALWISRKDFIILGEKAVNRDCSSVDLSPTATRGFDRTNSSRSNLSIVDCYSCGLSDSPAM